MRAVSPSIEAAALGCVLVVAGCYFGPSPRNYGPAREVHGRTAQIETQEADGSRIRVAGELLAVTDSNVVLRAERGEILAVAYPRTRWLRIQGRSTNLTGAQLSTSPRRRADVREFARFPYGVRPATLDTLLAGAGQTAPLAPGDPGTRPGIAVRLRAVTREQYDLSLRGELLAADSTALVIASDDRGVVRVAYVCLTRAALDGMDTPAGMGERRAPSDADIAALARRARFPRGLGANELARVLPAGDSGLADVRCD